MHEIPANDPGRIIDWSKTSEDYGKFRPGPPDSFYRKLDALDIGLSGQRMLDLGTGTGVLARTFAKNGAVVSGTDISAEQVRVAKELAKKQGQSLPLNDARIWE
jgi:2-polyprenyl-3-methyl-5-hydroxy-6-metoxy-1,4-benzoquinol methylase